MIASSRLMPSPNKTLSSRPQRSGEPGPRATAVRSPLGPRASAGITALLAGALFISTPALAQSAVTDATARAFVARQEAAWNGRDLDRFFGAFTPEARFTDQAYVGDKPPVPYGTSTLAQARTQSRRMLAKGASRETGRVVSVRVAPDGRSAQVVSRITTSLQAAGKTRRLCASRGQALVVRGGRLLSTGQTDTFYKCSP